MRTNELTMSPTREPYSKKGKLTIFTSIMLMLTLLLRGQCEWNRRMYLHPRLAELLRLRGLLRVFRIEDME